jgi:hypothetical protein
MRSSGAPNSQSIRTLLFFFSDVDTSHMSEFSCSSFLVVAEEGFFFVSPQFQLFFRRSGLSFQSRNA